MELMHANRQWSSRTPDERFTSMHALGAYLNTQRQNSARKVKANRELTVVPATTVENDIALQSNNGGIAAFTHWSFQQLASVAGVPAGYIRESKMPAPLAADNLNWGLHVARNVEEVSVLVRRDPATKNITLAAVNGPNYGIIWNSTIANQVIEHFGDGLNGDWRIPSEFGSHVDITKDNTTLYASDRDMWIFLADEDHRVEIDDRRDGQPGSFARGFFISNSEVGSGKARFGTFMFDYVCCNRIIWGARDFDEVAIRHTKGAPHRWLEEVAPVLKQLASASPEPIRESIAAAKKSLLGDKTAEFLKSRFGSNSIAKAIMQAHVDDEQRPIENVWDAVVGATAWARSIPFTDERVKVERTAGELLKLAA